MLHVSGKHVLNVAAVTGGMIRQLDVPGLLHFIQKQIFEDFMSPALCLVQQCSSECIGETRLYSSSYGETLAWFREMPTANLKAQGGVTCLQLPFISRGNEQAFI
jgi:hypothetical protein